MFSLFRWCTDLYEFLNIPQLISKSNKGPRGVEIRQSFQSFRWWCVNLFQRFAILEHEFIIILAFASTMMKMMLKTSHRSLQMNDEVEEGRWILLLLLNMMPKVLILCCSCRGQVRDRPRGRAKLLGVSSLSRIDRFKWTMKWKEDESYCSYWMWWILILLLLNVMPKVLM